MTLEDGERAWRDAAHPLPETAVVPIDEVGRKGPDVFTTLAQRGYVLVTDPAQADMHVSYQVAGQRRFVMADDRPVGASAATEAMTPGRTPVPPASSQLPREQTVRDGTVIIFIDDPRTRKLIWRGLINAETRVATTEGAIEQASNMVRQIAKEIPAGGG